MPKTSVEQIAMDEKKVMQQLLQDANESIDKIAKKCGFSRQKVWRIIKRLESNKTIWGYTAVIDDEKYGLKNYMVLIKKTNSPIKDVLEKIINRDTEKLASKIGVEIESTSYLHGLYDLCIHLNAADLKHAKKFCELINASYAGHIAELNLMENIFPIKKWGVTNPGIEKLKEFF